MAGRQIVPSMYSDKQISAKMPLAAYQMCRAPWHGTADEKLPASHLCRAASVSAAICVEQSSANSPPDYMCHDVRCATLVEESAQEFYLIRGVI